MFTLPDLIKSFAPNGSPQTILRGTGGWETDALRPGVVRPLVFGAAVPVVLTGSTDLFINLTTNAAFQFSNPTGPTTPVLFALRISNTSGGAHGAGTFAAAWKVAGNVTAIANGQNRTYLFLWDGTNAFEIVRGAADIPN